MAQLSKEVLERLQEEVKKDTTVTSSYGPRYSYWKPKKGTLNRIRILPGQEPGSIEKNFFVKIKQHSYVNPSSFSAVTCPRTLNPVAECPVCSRVDALYKSNNEQDRTIGSKIRAKERFFFGIIPLDGEQAGQIVIWSAPKVVRNAVVTYMSDSDYGDITHPTEGWDLKVTITGETFNNTVYTILPAAHASAITDDPNELAEILVAQPPLWKLRRAASPEDIRKFMSGELQNLPQGFYAVEEEDEDSEVPFDEEPGETIPVTTPVTVKLAPVKEQPVEDKSFEEEIVRAAPKAVATPAVNVEAPKRPKFDLNAINAQVKRIGKH
jgi:hypothetical protein